MPLSAVLFPGLDGSAALREPLIRRLRASAELHWIDYAELSATSPLDAARVLAERLPASCVVLGESFGGPLALLTASLRPERVAGVMLCASFARLPAPRMPAPVARWLADGCQRMPAALVGWALVNRRRGPEVQALMSALRALPPAQLQQRLRWLTEIDARAALSALPCPLHVVQAAGDRLLRWLPTAWPERATQRVVEGPHSLLQMRADVVADAFERFRAVCDLS